MSVLAVLALLAFGAAPSQDPPPEKPKGVLPPDPGLEGGKGGHWGTQGEKDWVDGRWSAMDTGPFMSSSLSVAGGAVAKAISVRLGEKGEAAMCFDAETLGFRAGWTGKFLAFSPARYGVIEMPRAAGDLQFVATPSWEKAGRYQGLHLHGKRCVFAYEVAGDRILDAPWIEAGGGAVVFTRTLESGRHALKICDLPEGSVAENLDEGRGYASVDREGNVIVAAVKGDGKVTWGGGRLGLELSGGRVKLFFWRGTRADLPKALALVTAGAGPEPLEPLTRPAEGRWGGPIAAAGQVSRGREPYVIDTLPVPFANPWKALMFITGVDFFENGDAAVCTLHGDVWRVSGIDDALAKVAWKRYATGLFQPLGLRVVGDRAHVLGRDQITRLHDADGDGEADFFENFNNDGKTSLGGHDYVSCLETDPAGNFYYVSTRGLHRVSADGRTVETVATGWRNPNGMSVGPDGTITVAPQEGEWTPASAITVARPGGYYGYGGPKPGAERPLGYDPPLCWIPRAIDNSTGGQVWVTSDRWGPLKGQLLNLSFGQSSMQLVLRDPAEGVVQGGVVPLKLHFASGAMRGRFRPKDGQLYVVGSKGWVTNAVRDGSFQRVRYSGGKIGLPVGLSVGKSEVRLKFAEPLDRELAESSDNWAIEQWNYRYTAQYGSKEYSVIHPNVVGHDPVAIGAIRLSSDGREVALEIPGLRPVMQMRIRYSLRDSEGAPVKGELVHTVNVVK